MEKVRKGIAIYKNTRICWLVIIVLAMIAIVASLTDFIRDLHSGLGFGGFILILSSLLFKVTIIINDESVKVSIGLGIIREKIQLQAITSCEPVSNLWITYNVPFGFGPGWRTYNAWGKQAVELRHKNGRVYRIGTAEPEEMSQNIRERIKRLEV